MLTFFLFFKLNVGLKQTGCDDIKVKSAVDQIREEIRKIKNSIYNKMFNRNKSLPAHNDVALNINQDTHDDVNDVDDVDDVEAVDRNQDTHDDVPIYNEYIDQDEHLNVPTLDNSNLNYDDENELLLINECGNKDGLIDYDEIEHKTEHNESYMSHCSTCDENESYIEELDEIESVKENLAEIKKEDNVASMDDIENRSILINNNLEEPVLKSTSRTNFENLELNVHPLFTDVQKNTLNGSTKQLENLKRKKQAKRTFPQKKQKTAKTNNKVSKIYNILFYFICSCLLYPLINKPVVAEPIFLRFKDEFSVFLFVLKCISNYFLVEKQ